MEKVLAWSATTNSGPPKPQWNTLDIGASALREQQSRLERGFHVRGIHGWYQNRLHHQLLRSLQMNGSAMQANGTNLAQVNLRNETAKTFGL
jgi:hypothetical protein